MKIKARALVKQYSAEYWKSEISKAEDRSKKFVETAEESIRVFNAQKQVGLLNDAERRINVWCTVLTPYCLLITLLRQKLRLACVSERAVRLLS